MSILIKGIDMPKDYVLRIEIEPNGTVWEEGRDWIKHRQSAIQIDRPHGRLIDGDKLRATLQRWTEDEWNQKASPVSWAYAYEDIIDLIDDAPTILEAEE